MKHSKQATMFLKALLCAVLIAAMALTLAACTGNAPTNSAVTLKDGDTVGEGGRSFTLQVVDKDGQQIQCTIRTDEKTVGEALQALGIIKGEAGAYGLYIKSVNGITADYDIDGTYWAFYVNGEYASSGVDQTAIEADKVYALKAEKG